MNTNCLTVYKSNAIIEAGYKLSLNELRILLACIAQIDSRKEILVSDKFELSAKDFAVIFDVSEDRAYHALGEVAKILLKRYLTIENPFPDNPRIDKLQTHWISAIYYIKKESKIALSFSHELIPYLSDLKGKFTKYELKYIGKMTSIYAIRLYELLMQWKTAGKREIEIAQLKRLFELDSSYDRMFDLKKRVIDPAVKDINEHSNFFVTWEQRKTGRAVTHLIFTFAEKQPETPEEKSQEIKPTPKAAITLTEEQQACFDWAKNNDFWKKFATSKNSFLKCFNNEDAGELSLKNQWLRTLPSNQQPKKEKTAEVLKREVDLEQIHLQNEIANLELLNKGSNSPALKEQLAKLKERLK